MTGIALPHAYTGKIRDLLGWTPRIPLDQTLLEVIAEFRSRIGPSPSREPVPSADAR